MAVNGDGLPTYLQYTVDDAQVTAQHAITSVVFPRSIGAKFK